MSLIDEIRSQPQVLARTVEANRGPAGQVADLMRRSSYVVIAGRGTSDNAGRYAQYLWGARNGLSVALTTPSLFSIYDSPPRLDGALVIGISQSGQSPDIVSVLEEGRTQGRGTVAITNEPMSPLAQTADVVIDLGAGVEEAVAATKTYTAQLAVIALVSEALAGRALPSGQLGVFASRALEQEEEAAGLAASFEGVDHGAVLGRGVNHATAYEWALKLQELAHVVAQPFSTADFLHGPIALLEPSYPVLAIAAAGPAIDDARQVLSRCREAGAELLVISNDEVVSRLTPYALSFGADVEEWLSPIPAIVLAQLFVHHLTLAKGLDPDAPRGLHKVTRTT